MTIPIVERAGQFLDRIAVCDDGGELTYRELLERSARVATTLLDGKPDLDGGRVAFLTPPGIDYVLVQWGIWRAGGIAVPLCTSHPAPELDYTIADSDAETVVSHPEFAGLLEPIARARNARLLVTDGLRDMAPGPLPDVRAERAAMLLYTSGTTGKPKGVVSTHSSLGAQIQSVVAAWEWSQEDHVLHVLPLHHLHGVLNLLCSALYSGARCELLSRFDADRVFARIAEGRGLTLFMAVPTIYAKLIEVFDRSSPSEQRAFTEGCGHLRLMVSGSAALPAAVLGRFREISGHVLLERYGMTEFGMGLGNPLHGERRAGCVGVPFPGVEVRLVEAVESEPRELADGVPGQIEVRGAGVFREYWRRPEATREAFTPDGWFKTGDVAVRERGYYRILGRESVDILKTGGYKVSALEIEEALREHPAIAECAVVGVPDETWGQRVAAAVVLAADQTLELEDLRGWAKARLAPYKVPTLLRLFSSLPRNPMGKVQKPDLVKEFLERA
jgi:malonyl-CoA/methylmalonyl-CoA synthetase